MSLDQDERLVVVDVGGLGGLPDCWHPHLDRILPIIFEPNPPAAEAIRQAMPASAVCRVIECALGDREERRILHVTKSLGCTSVLSPNQSLLAPFSVARAFDVTHEIDIACLRYDALCANGDALPPDAIKVDVQGFEYEVLSGFGDLLRDCLAVQIEAHFYPIYKSQKLLHHLIDLLQGFGLALVKIEPVHHFDGCLVEVDAWFARDIRSAAALGERQRRKLDLISKVWSLPQRGRNFGDRQFE